MAQIDNIVVRLSTVQVADSFLHDLMTALAEGQTWNTRMG